jgi:hypothetical protein
VCCNAQPPLVLITTVNSLDHNGWLFMDDARIRTFTSCFKGMQHPHTSGLWLLLVDVKFIDFFFERLQRNSTGRYTSEFPFMSLCGRLCGSTICSMLTPSREINFLAVDDQPIVFHKLREADSLLVYGGSLTMPACLCRHMRRLMSF